MATALACGHWNDGQVTFNSSLYKRLGISTGNSTKALWKQIDEERIYSAERKCSEQAKQRRRNLHLTRSKKLDKQQYEEGGPSYKAGGFLTAQEPKKSRASPKCTICGNPRKGHQRGHCGSAK